MTVLRWLLGITLAVLLIPVALPNNTLITSSELTGAVPSFSMMYAPWANQLGGV